MEFPCCNLISKSSSKWQIVTTHLHSLSTHSLPSIITSLTKVISILKPINTTSFLSFFTSLSNGDLSLENTQNAEIKEVLVKISELVLMTEELFPDGEIKLGNGWFTNKQIACVIAHGFLCIIEEWEEGVDMPPVINFGNWYGIEEDVYVEKMTFYYNYF